MSVALYAFPVCRRRSCTAYSTHRKEASPTQCEGCLAGGDSSTPTCPNPQTRSARSFGRRSRKIHIRLVIVSSGTSCISRRSATFGSQSRRVLTPSLARPPASCSIAQNRSRPRLFLESPIESANGGPQGDDGRTASDSLTLSPSRRRMAGVCAKRPPAGGAFEGPAARARVRAQIRQPDASSRPHSAGSTFGGGLGERPAMPRRIEAGCIGAPHRESSRGPEQSRRHAGGRATNARRSPRP